MSGDSYTWANDAELPAMTALGWTPAPYDVCPRNQGSPGQLLQWHGAGYPQLPPEGKPDVEK